MHFFDYSGFDLETQRSKDILGFIKNFLREHRPCGDLDIRRVFNSDVLAALLASKSFQSMKAVECMFDNQVFVNQLKRDARTHLNHTQKFIKKTKELSSGTYGETSIVKVTDTDIEFVCKKQINESNVGIDIIEYFIGAAVLNQMRKLCPTFCYTLGTFECGKVPASSGELCGTDATQTSFIVLEHIKGEVLQHFLKTDDVVSFMSLLVQLLLALELAQREARFCHYDLSITNIMVSSEKEDFQIALDDKMYSFTRSPKAVIIDYGTSSVSFQGKNISPEFALSTWFDYKLHKHSYLVQGFDILYFLTSVMVYGYKSPRITKFVSDIIFTEIFQNKFGVPDDPYKLKTKPSDKGFITDYGSEFGRQIHLEYEFTTDYCGRYVDSKLASITPGMILDQLMSIDEFREMVKPLLQTQKRTTLDYDPLKSRDPSGTRVKNLLRDLYSQEIPEEPCLSEFKSYMLITDAIQKAADRTLRAKLEQERAAGELVMKANDNQLLDKFSRLIIDENIPNEAMDILNIKFTDRLDEPAYRKLGEFLRKSSFMQYIEYYTHIYYLILQLKLETQEPYKRFVDFYNTTPLQLLVFNTTYTFVSAARRWTITLFDKRLSYIKNEDIRAVVFNRPTGKRLIGAFTRNNELDGLYLQRHPGEAKGDVIYHTEYSDKPNPLSIMQALNKLYCRVILVFTRAGVWEIRANKQSSVAVDLFVQMHRDIEKIVSSSENIIDPLQRMLAAFEFSIKYTPLTPNDMYELVFP